jgi:hypothetical protein
VLCFLSVAAEQWATIPLNRQKQQFTLAARGKLRGKEKTSETNENG